MTSNEASQAQRRLLVALDMKGYSSGHGEADHYRAQQALMDVLADAASQTPIARLDWTRQEAGDGELAVLPPDEDGSTFIGPLVRGLKAALYRHNTTKLPRVRLRVALHQGRVRRAPGGWSGNAVVDVSRICNARQVGDRLDRHPQADLVLAISDCLYRDIEDLDFHDLAPSTFERELVTEKQFSGFAYLHVDRPSGTGRVPVPPPPMRARPASPRAAPSDGTPAGSEPRHGGLSIGSVHSGRDTNVAQGDQHITSYGDSWQPSVESDAEEPS